MIATFNTDDNVFVRAQHDKVFQRLNAQSNYKRQFLITVGNMEKRGDTELTLVHNDDIIQQNAIYIGENRNLKPYSIYFKEPNTKKYQKIEIRPCGAVIDPWGETDESIHHFIDDTQKTTRLPEKSRFVYCVVIINVTSYELKLLKNAPILSNPPPKPPQYTDDELIALFDDVPATAPCPKKKKSKQTAKQAITPVVQTVVLDKTDSADTRTTVESLDTDSVDSTVASFESIQSIESSESFEPIESFDSIQSIEHVEPVVSPPFTVLFHRSLPITDDEKEHLRTLLYDLYDEHTNFYTTMAKYDEIVVIKSIHDDRRKTEWSTHFNIYLNNTITHERTNSYHAYIHQNRINRLTQLVDLI